MNQTWRLPKQINLSGKQNTLISGTNIKTINGESILGAGNINSGLKIYNMSFEFGNVGEVTIAYLSQEQIDGIIAADFVLLNQMILLTKFGTDSSTIQLFGSTASYGEYLYFAYLIIDINSKECNGIGNQCYISQIHKLVITTSDSTMTLNPNRYYRNTNTSLSTLNITLSAMYDNDILSEYFVEFTTSSSGTTISLPSTIKWANGKTPVFEASTTYQISIINNLGVVAKFK